MKHEFTKPQIDHIRDAYEEAQEAARKARAINIKEIAAKFEVSPELIAKVISGKTETITKLDEEDFRLIRSLYNEHLRYKSRYDALKPATLAEMYKVSVQAVKDICAFKTYTYV